MLLTPTRGSPRRNRRIFRRLSRRLPQIALALASLAGSGCTLGTHDIHGPLVVDELPAKDARFFHCTDYAISLARVAWGYSQIHKYDDEGNYRNLERDASAITFCPDNAFAWIILGSDLALLQQANLAITATVEGQNRLPSWQQARQPRYVSQLRFVALLNLADYNIELGDYGAALDALNEVEKPENLDAFRRLAFYFRATEARVGLKDEKAAREMLDLARGVRQDELDQLSLWAQINYPQYFSRGIREAHYAYLEGQIKLAAGNPHEAKTALEEAIAKYPQLWEAHFALANAYLDEQDFESAARRYEELLRIMKEKMVIRTERISFNLGTAYYEQHKWSLAATSFKRAVDIVKYRSRRFRKHVKRMLRERDPALLVRSVVGPGLEQAAEIFPEAYNNLGNCHVQLWLQDHRESELMDAEKAVKEALKSSQYDESYVAHANLGRVYWYRQRYDLYLAEMDLALTLTPSYREALDDLYGKSEELNPGQRVTAYNALLDALVGNGPRKYVSERFGDWLDKIESFVDANTSVPMAARGKAKVLYLRSRDVAALDIYNDSGTAEDSVWKAVGKAQLEWSTQTGNKAEIEGLLSRAIDEMEHGRKKVTWTLADVRNAYLLRATLRSASGDKLGANSDSAKAEKAIPRTAEDHQ
jgi:tetratricopeptide (TPR) repeat protein